MLRALENVVGLEVVPLDTTGRPVGATRPARLTERGWEISLEESAAMWYLVRAKRKTENPPPDPAGGFRCV
ncbi:MAG: hypothetical protein U1E27_12035 [Kiritimatiellia bacterium]|nr:hypothetical protein [Kiritimatiellia bacterium]